MPELHIENHQIAMTFKNLFEKFKTLRTNFVKYNHFHKHYRENGRTNNLFQNQKPYHFHNLKVIIRVVHQRWLWDGIFRGSKNGNFSFRARSKNLVGLVSPKIPNDGDLGFFKIWGFFGDGDFSGMGIFFVGWDIPPKSHLWLFIPEIPFFSYGQEFH